MGPSVWRSNWLRAIYFKVPSTHTTLRFAQWKRPPDIDSQFIQAIQPWIGPLTTKKVAEFKQDHEIRQNNTVRTSELFTGEAFMLIGQRVQVRWTTANSQLTTVRYMTPWITTDFFFSRNATGRMPDTQNSAGLSRKKAYKIRW
jgi:hypothetical protein